MKIMKAFDHDSRSSDVEASGEETNDKKKKVGQTKTLT